VYAQDYRAYLSFCQSPLPSFILRQFSQAAFGFIPCLTRDMPESFSTATVEFPTAQSCFLAPNPFNESRIVMDPFFLIVELP
jgi:hypothetical protein